MSETAHIPSRPTVCNSLQKSSPRLERSEKNRDDDLKWRSTRGRTRLHLNHLPVVIAQVQSLTSRSSHAPAPPALRVHAAELEDLAVGIHLHDTLGVIVPVAATTHCQVGHSAVTLRSAALNKLPCAASVHLLSPNDELLVGTGGCALAPGTGFR